MSVYHKLSEIQSLIKVNKSQYNSFGKYSYRSAEDILNAAKPICKDNGCVLTLSDDIVALEGRFYVKAVATLTEVDSLETVQVTAFAREEENKKGMDASQVTGSCSSYARKYALNGLFNLDDAKDADTDAYTQTQRKASSKKADPEEPKTHITKAEAEFLHDLISNTQAADPVEVRVEKVCRKYGVNDLQELNPSDYLSLVKSLG